MIRRHSKFLLYCWNNSRTEEELNQPDPFSQEQVARDKSEVEPIPLVPCSLEAEEHLPLRDKNKDPPCVQMIDGRAVKDKAYHCKKGNGKRPIVFIHVPKTGGETLEEALNISKSHEPLRRRLGEVFSGEKMDTKRDVAVLLLVRNPYERMWSWFKFCLHGYKGRHVFPENVCSLADWLLLCILQPQF